MRSVSPTNSNPWKNVRRRRAFMRWFGDRCWLVGHLSHKCWGPLDPHHIHFVGGIRWDLCGNLIPICRGAHDWIHPKNRIDGTVLCMAAKLVGRTRAAKDRIREHWHRALGRDAVECWLSVRRDQGRIAERYLADAEFVLEQFT
jgi:hypothetical protein